VKSVLVNVVRPSRPQPFQIHRLGIREMMRPGLVDRPLGTGDYLFMLFHAAVQIRAGGENRVQPTSSFMIWTPKDGHFYGSDSSSWCHSWFHCAGREIAALLRTTRIPVGQPFPLTAPIVMERYLLESVAELKGWSKPDARVLRNLFENLIRNLARNLFDRTERLPPSRLLELRTFIEEHFAEVLSLPLLARRAGWSIPHLCTEFKRYFGISIFQYVKQLRMNQASYLLRDHNWRIGEIAAAVGYVDLYTFSKMFRRSLGLCPRKFRQMSTR
jgi:AraC-like DNA-binding protein